MIVNKFKILIILFLVFISCKNETIENSRDTNEIVSLLIERSFRRHPAFNLPPPYKIKNIEKNFAGGKFIIVLDTIMKPISNSFNIKKYKSEYNDLFQNLRLLKNSISINPKDLIINDSIRLLTVTDSIKTRIRKKRDYEGFHKFVSFSRIIFNKDTTKAMVTIADNLSSLAGSYDLCFLEKKDGKWRIRGFQNISIS